MLQYDQYLKGQQYQGVNSGYNANAGTLFGVLRLYGVIPDELIDVFRRIGSTVGELFAYISTKTYNNSVLNSNLRILNYVNVMGAPLGTGYLSRLGGFNKDARFYPLAKYFAIGTGRGNRPISTPAPRIAFLETGGVAVDQTRLIPDGNSVVLLHGGLAQGVPANQVQVEASLADRVLSFTNVTRAYWPGLNNPSVNLQNLAITFNNGIRTSLSSGYLNTILPIMCQGVLDPFAIRFTVDYFSNIDNQSWIGNYGANIFDGSTYSAAVAKLVKGLTRAVPTG